MKPQRSRHGEIRFEDYGETLYLVCGPTGDEDWWTITTLSRPSILWLVEEQTAAGMDKDPLVLSPEEWL